VTANEFAFLTLGLILGAACGAALVDYLRARPAAAREVRITIAPDAVPRRRAATLTDDAFGPARGGPADRRTHDRLTRAPAGVMDRGTSVHSGLDRLAAPVVVQAATGGGALALPIAGGRDPMLAAIRAGTAAVGNVARHAEERLRHRRGTTTMLMALDADPAGGAGPVAAVAEDVGSGTGRCAELRRLADERCELASHAKARAAEARTVLRDAQRSYDEHVARAEAATATADPRSVRARKDAAHAEFRAARSGAATTEALEAAARDWLQEINRINAETREAVASASRDTDAARALAATLGRLTVEADAARIAAETADAACLSARQSAADCDEGSAPAETTWPVPEPAGPWPVDEDGLAAAFDATGTSLILRLLRGERAAMMSVVGTLAGDDAGERRRWQIAMSDLVDAILATAIEANALEFPEDHPFWGAFTQEQDRDISGALAALGYRFDGLGGWTDGRIPTQRDLSLALGYAGLDPMRIRPWPSEPEMAELLRDVRVAADRFLASAAGDLSLGELVTLLGRRADDLADVWNGWGRIRPLLLAET
jgi:hypothetical protein